MGRTVKVEGKIAATTTSKHIARATEPDMRLKGNQPVERKNWIETEHLSKDRTTNTKFSGGWVWKSDTLCGEPPATHDMPADSLPGVANGGAVNSYAEAQPAQGAQTVYVEGKKVIRHEDKTFQNKRNSKGKIINAEDLAAYLAEPLKPDTPPPPPPPRVPTAVPALQGGNKGTTTPAGGKKAPPPPPPAPGTDPTKDCSLLDVAISRDGGALQSLPTTSDQPGHLWIRDDHNLRVKVTTEKCCKDHPVITFGSETQKGKTDVTFNPSNVFRLAERILLNLLVPGSGALPPRPVQTALTVQSCKKQFSRKVVVMGRETAAVNIGNGNQASDAIKTLLKTMPMKLPLEKFEFFKGQVSFKFQWAEETNWAGALQLEVTGKLTIIKAEIKALSIPLYTFIPGGQILTVLDKIANKFGVPVTVAFEITFSGALEVGADLKLKALYGTQLQKVEGSLFGAAVFTVGARLNVKCTESFKAVGGIEGEVKFKGTWAGGGFPTVFVDMSVQAGVKLKVELTISIGWVDVGGDKEYPIWESPEKKLGKVEFFTAGPCIPIGYTAP